LDRGPGRAPHARVLPFDGFEAQPGRRGVSERDRLADPPCGLPPGAPDVPEGLPGDGSLVRGPARALPRIEGAARVVTRMDRALPRGAGDPGRLGRSGDRPSGSSL